MKSSSVAAGLLLVVLGFALAFLPRRAALAGAVLAAGMSLVGAALPGIDARLALAGVWVSLIIASLIVYWPKLVRKWPLLGFALPPLAGLCSGLLAGRDGGLAAALILPLLLVSVPAVWCIQRGWTLVPRVVTSWLLTVALLMAALIGLLVRLALHLNM